MDKDTMARAADFLEQYAAFIRREVMAVDIEQHPYLPELDEVAAELRAAGSPSKHAPNYHCECHDCHIARTRGPGLMEETTFEKSARWAWPDGRPDL
jgi:hypothetical protein